MENSDDVGGSKRCQIPQDPFVRSLFKDPDSTNDWTADFLVAVEEVRSSLLGSISMSFEAKDLVTSEPSVCFFSAIQRWTCFSAFARSVAHMVMMMALSGTASPQHYPHHHHVLTDFERFSPHNNIPVFRVLFSSLPSPSPYGTFSPNPFTTIEP